MYVHVYKWENQSGPGMINVPRAIASIDHTILASSSGSLSCHLKMDDHGYDLEDTVTIAITKIFSYNCIFIRIKINEHVLLNMNRFIRVDWRFFYFLRFSRTVNPETTLI